MKPRFLFVALTALLTGLAHAEDPGIEVFKPDGTLQCGMGSEVSLEKMAAQLRAAGVEVLGSRKGSDGLMRAAVCGAETGAINLYRIPADDLEAAAAAGFRRLGEVMGRP